jgi:hypothetical protein
VASSSETDREVTKHRLDNHEKILHELVKGFSDLKEAVLSIPKQSSMGERAKVISATVGVMTAVFVAANTWLYLNLAPDRQTTSRIERNADDIPLLRYRIEQLEKFTSGPSR